MIHPKKGYGQNFLINKGAIDKIVDIISEYRPNHVLEIGPGRGELTIPLANKIPYITAVEIDVSLFRLLEQKIKEFNIRNVRLIHGDFLRQDLNEILQDDTLVIGNLPYNISTLIIQKLENAKDRIEKAIIMLQREVAERLCANPGGKAYGSLSVLVQYQAKVQMLMKLKSGSFWPRPKVDSVLVAIDYRQPYPLRANEEEAFKRLVRGLFLHRRKKLLKSIKYIYKIDDEVLKAIINRLGISQDTRPEDLPVESFVMLSNEIHGFINNPSA